MNTAASLFATATATRARFSDYLELTKPRLSLLSVMTAGIGYLAARPERNLGQFALTMVGTALAAGGAATLNQWLETDTDALMMRTKDRPLPGNRIPTGSAFVLGALLCLASMALLFAAVNPLAALLVLATIVCYLGVYTPAKRWSRFSTEIGAISGALPPVIGWSAAEGRISELGWILFGVLLFWQIPHFMAIAWTYRRDYATVNFPMLSVRDETGGMVAAWTLVSTGVLVAVSLLPAVFGLATWAYGAVAIGLGLWFLFKAVRFNRRAGREAAARRLFFASLAYLPGVLCALVLDRWLLLR